MLLVILIKIYIRVANIGDIMVKLWENDGKMMVKIFKVNPSVTKQHILKARFTKSEV